MLLVVTLYTFSAQTEHKSVIGKAPCKCFVLRLIVRNFLRNCLLLAVSRWIFLVLLEWVTHFVRTIQTALRFTIILPPLAECINQRKNRLTDFGQRIFHPWWNQLSTKEKEEAWRNFRAFPFAGSDRWALEDVNEFTKWDNRITLIDQFPMFKNIPRDSLSTEMRQFMDYSDKNGRSSIFHLKV